MNAGKAVYGILSGTTAVTDIVGTRIFPEIAEQEAVTPFIVYQLQSVDPEDTHDGPSKLDEVRFEFLCYADSYNAAADLGVAVRAALDRVSGTYNGVNVESVQFNDVDVDIEYDPRRYSQVLNFTFRIKRDDIEIALGTPVTGAQLGDLSDVNVSGVTDNQVLSYDAATDSWVPAADAGGAEQLDDLTDVKIVGTPSEGDALVYQSGFFQLGQAGATTLAELDDVSDLAPSGNQVLTWSSVSNEWQPSTPASPPPAVDELNDLNDVTIATPATNQILRFTGSVFSNQDLTQYYNRYATEAETLRAGATATVELYYTAQADGDGYAESASSDTASAGNVIRRKLYYSEAAQADCDSGTWVQFAEIADDTTFSTAKATLLAYLKQRTGGTVPISLKMTWEDVAASSLLLDNYTATHAYSTRLLRTAYTGSAIRVRRASDNSEQDIGFSSGELDTTSLASFCSGTNGFVVKWYDQQGSNDITQSTTSQQPKIYDSSTGVLTQNGKPIMKITTSGTDMNFTTQLSINPAHTFGVSMVDSANYRPMFGRLNGGGEIFLSASGDSNPAVVGTGLYINGASSTITTRAQVYTQFVNQTLFASRVPLTGGDRTTLGFNVSNSTNYSMHNMQEVVIFNGAQSDADRDGIIENINNYFTVYS